MVVQIPRHGAIKGCTVYAAPNGVASKTPACIDASVKLPQLSFPTNTIQAMGDFDIPDQTRLDAMTCTISVEAGVESNELMQSGNASYIIRWGQEVTNPDGTIGLEKWQAFVSGIVASSPAPSLEVGQSGTSDITINVSRYRLVHNDVNELYAIDRIAGILRINGEDLRAPLNDIL